jgi:exoribonuclease R
MTARRTRVAPTAALTAGLDALRSEAGVPDAFPPEAEAEAAAAAGREPQGERVDLPFVTIDPPGSRDLDQALHIARRGDGHRVSYAIADVAAWVAPGGAVDRAAHARGVTVYAPDHRTPLHPPVLSEGGASLLPGQWCPAVLWTLDLDATGELVGTAVVRALVQSRAQHTYEDVPAELAPLLQEVGERRAALQRARGGVQLDVPEQEVVQEDGGWTTRFRAVLPSEDWNAQVSLLTGMAAAQLMLRAGTGILRTQPDPDSKALSRLRLQATALGAPWPVEEPYSAFIARLDGTVPAHAALLREATGVGRGAGYTAFDGAPPQERRHFALAAEYAHATAPLRRLQDRHVSECCLAAHAGRPVPDWVRAALPGLPATMAAATRRANAVERGVLDLVEALLLHGREGERFDGLVVDDDLVQLTEPAVRAKLPGAPEPGTPVTVVLEQADPAARKVAFRLA